MTRSAKTPFIALGFALGTLASAPAHAQDSDGDGAANINDAYPCDASIAAVSFAPAEGQHAALLFEDQWPQLGDADFNDAVITYNYVVRENAAGQAVTITATFNALALGGVFDNGLGLHLPIPAANVAGVTLTQGMGSPQPLTVSGVDTELTVQVINNLRTLFGGQAGVINAIDGATISSEALQVDITLSTPIALDLSVAPFDVYLFRSTTPAHEIHRNGYTGTAAMDTTLFNTDSDASRPGLSFVDVRGLPFVLHIPQFNVYAKEATDIAQLWPRIMSFVASGGVQDQDFYTGDAVLANAFAGSQSLSPSLLSTLPTADTTCVVPGTSSNPGTSCLSILAASGIAGAVNGSYWVDPDGTGAFQATCDMTAGGWTQVGATKFKALVESNLANISVLNLFMTTVSDTARADTICMWGRQSASDDYVCNCPSGYNRCRVVEWGLTGVTAEYNHSVGAYAGGNCANYGGVYCKYGLRYRIRGNEIFEGYRRTPYNSSVDLGWNHNSP